MQSYYRESDSNSQGKSFDLAELKAALLLTLDLGYEFVKEISQKPLAMGEEVVEKAGEKGKDVLEKGKDVVDKGVDTAKKHPIATLLAAFGLGFLVVKLLKRK